MKKVTKQKSKLKMPMIVAGSVILLAGLALLLVYFFESDKTGENKAYTSKPIQYYPADFEADIMQNRVYLSFDRDLYFGTQVDERQYNYEKDLENASPEAAFFLNFFDTLIRGDNENILSFFVDGYFQNKPHFTMQMIHNMRVIFHSLSTEEIDGETVEIYNYTVTYEIFQNNGTWRQGVGSNDARPQIYQLIRDENDSYKIFRILNVTVE